MAIAPGPSAREGDGHQLKWVDINDFSPGAYNHRNFTSELASPGTQPLLPAPLGAHDPAYTYGCLILPGGGIGAQPLMAGTIDFTENSGGISGAGNYVVGFLAHDELADGDTEIFFVWEADDGTTHYWYVYSYLVTAASYTLAVHTANSTGSGIFGSPYPQLTRVAVSDPTTTPGTPVIVFPNGGPATSTDADTGQVYLWPDPNTPSTPSVLPLITGSMSPYSSVAGQVIVHQSRIVVLAGITYDYPVGSGFETNEQVNYTDPGNSTDYGFQQTVYAPEEPYGYGCGGSVSAGELFLVKKRGGGLIVSGDLNNPTVTFLPGVQPTGGIYGQCAEGVGGLYYCSYDNGAWVWNGSNTSEKISAQIDDNFFLPNVFSTMDSNNYGFFAQCIGDKVYFSNNWMYDTRTGSWWIYYPRATQGGTDLYYVNPVSGPIIWAAPLNFTKSGPIFFEFNTAKPTPKYVWTSVPLRLAGEDRVVDIREVVVRASNTASNATVQVTVSQAALNVGVTPTSMDVDLGPDMLRFNFNALGMQEPQVSVVVESSSPTPTDMPVIHSISIGYKIRAHAEVQN
jgi:hypothetical protein